MQLSNKQKPANGHVEIDAALQGAVERRELELYFQPRVAIKSGDLVGAEALLRWNSPQLGRIPPDQFVPAAEESGLIVEIGRWVLEQACHQMGSLSGRGFPPLRTSVNVSPKQLDHGAFHTVVAEVLQEAGYEPTLLELEVTETVAFKGGEAAKRCLDEIRAMGVHLSLDDFGTGYSSLRLLTDLPLTTLKLDRSFTIDLGANPQVEAVVESTIKLAERLGLTVCAEGVDTQEQINVLHRFGCHEMQGFWIAPAMDIDAFARWRLDYSPTGQRD